MNMTRFLLALTLLGVTIAPGFNSLFLPLTRNNHVLSDPSPDLSKDSLLLFLAETENLLLSQNKPNQQQEVDGFKSLMEYAQKEKLSQGQMSEIIHAIAGYFLGTPYQEGLLDQFQEETLYVSLKGFDCVLFVETVLAIAQGVAVQDYSYQTLLKNIESLRYVNGTLQGYCSRLHYFSDWIEANKSRGNVENITGKLGGISLNKKLNFMSNHRGSYPQLVDDKNYQCIVQREQKLASLPFQFIPTNQIKSIYSQLKTGDIIAVATNIEGLDFTHTGFVYQNDDNTMGFIHASPIGKVTIARDLSQYIARVKNAIGIVVVRSLDPRLKNHLTPNFKNN
ncbi:MAG: N-acetylmuramoyl-L-alanine amidase-like domain-containing protein [Microcoleaceae cyanobacterium]